MQWKLTTAYAGLRVYRFEHAMVDHLLKPIPGAVLPSRASTGRCPAAADAPRPYLFVKTDAVVDVAEALPEGLQNWLP
jgi:hypothetical protein